MLNIIEKIFPAHCISCGQQGEYVCKICKRNLLPHPEICPVCHRFSANYETCLDCKSEKKWYLEGIIIPFAYSNEIKKLILKLKYGHKKDVIDFLTDRLILALQLNQKISIHFPLLDKVMGNEIPHSGRGGQGVGLNEARFLVTFVPSHRYRKYFTKGYNQSELLAKNLAKKLGLPCSQLVQKTKHTKSQAGLDRKARLTNLQNTFSLKQTNLNENDTVILVDDVTTTGSTLNQIAKSIKKGYPKAKIRGLVLARHIG